MSGKLVRGVYGCSAYTGTIPRLLFLDRFIRPRYAIAERSFGAAGGIVDIPSKHPARLAGLELLR
jgi:hypothetical protein